MVRELRWLGEDEPKPKVTVLPEPREDGVLAIIEVPVRYPDLRFGGVIRSLDPLVIDRSMVAAVNESAGTPALRLRLPPAREE